MKRTAIWFFALLLGATSAFGQDLFNKGKVALATHDTAAAIQAFKDAVKANQKVADATYYLGTLAFGRQEYDDAQSYLETSVRLNDENVDALTALTAVYMAKKNTAAALATMKKAQKVAPKNVAVVSSYAFALLAADSVDQSIVQFTRAKDLDPANAAIYVGLGDAYLKQNVAPLGIMNYQKAIELAPRKFEYRYTLAQIYEKNRQYTEAIAQYDSVATLDPTNTEALLQMGQILVRASGNQKKLGIPPLKKFVEKNPKSAPGYTLLTKILFLTEEYEDAAKTAKTATELDPKNPELWREYAYSSVEVRDFKTGLTGFEKIQELKAFKDEDYTKYGLALFGVGREDDALQALLAAVKADSTDCDPYSSLGSIYMKKKDYVNAAKMFEKKIACEPKVLTPYLNAAMCYMTMKEWVRSRQLLDTVLTLKPDYISARFWLARYFLQVDSLDRAKDQYDLVLQQTASNPEKYKTEIGEAHSMTGSYYFTVQRYANAVEEFRKALAAGYENTGLHLSWGQAVLQTLSKTDSEEEGKKKKDDAIRHFRRSIDMDSKNAGAHLWLAQTLIMSRVMGDDAGNKVLKEEACTEYHRALALQPNNADAKKGLEMYGCK